MARRRRTSGGPRGGGPRLNREIQGLLTSLARRHPVAAVVLLLVGLLVAGAYLYFQNRDGSGAWSTDLPEVNSPLPRPQPVPGVPADPAAWTRAHLMLGNPSGATDDPSRRDDFLLLKPYYALSYNDSAGTANWVSWRLTRADLGSAPRPLEFLTDPLLPRGFKRVTHKDYSGSGFDRGHLCPHGDRDATPESARATFVMTNIIPQAPNVNQGAWNDLETYCRELVTRHNRRLYIVSGPAGRGGRLAAGGSKTSIAGGKVAVPAECWKIAVVVPETGGADDPSTITATTRVIAVVMPNDDTAVRDDWTSYRTSPAAIERRTGYRFFDRLPADVADALRRKVDDERVAPPSSSKGRTRTRR